MQKVVCMSLQLFVRLLLDRQGQSAKRECSAREQPNETPIEELMGQ